MIKSSNKTNILIFRTDRFGDFLISKIFINNLKDNYKDCKIDVVCSQYNYDLVKKFKFIDNVIIYKKGFFNFFKLQYFFFNLKYNYIFVLDGKKRSILNANFIKSEKKSIYLKDRNLAKFCFNFKVFYHNTKEPLANIYNSILKFYKIKVSKKNFKIFKDFKFKKIDLKVPKKKYTFFHFDEKWFKHLYYFDYSFCDWDYNFFDKIINLLSLKNKNIFITSGKTQIPFVENLIKNKFVKINTELYKYNNKRLNVFLIKNNSFFDIINLMYSYAKILVCCEGGLSHVSFGLNLPTFAFIEKNRTVFYSSWTKHMKKIKLLYRGNQKSILNQLSKI